MILQTTTLIDGTDKVRIELKSLINQWKETRVIFKSGKERTLNAVRVYLIRTYLKGYLASRLRALESKGYRDSAKYKSIYNLKHYVETKHPHGKPTAYMAWIARRADTLRGSLPKEVNKSHEKVESILKVCSQYIE